MRLSREEYKKAEGYLKRYNYNCINILNIRNDIMTLSAVNLDGLPKAPYSISDSVFNSVIKLQENKELNKSISEYKVVVQALQLVSDDSKVIFEELYQKSKSKWDVMNEKGLSERTFVRRKGELINTVHKELKKFGVNLA
jgi:DNA-directed RNA polymerase specialized sigma subunit